MYLGHLGSIRLLLSKRQRGMLTPSPGVRGRIEQQKSHSLLYLIHGLSRVTYDPASGCGTILERDDTAATCDVVGVNQTCPPIWAVPKQGPGILVAAITPDHMKQAANLEIMMSTSKQRVRESLPLRTREPVLD